MLSDLMSSASQDGLTNVDLCKRVVNLMEKVQQPKSKLECTTLLASLAKLTEQLNSGGVVLNTTKAAFGFLDKMKEHKLLPNVAVYACMIKVCAANNYLDKAFEVFEAMRQDKVMPNEYIFTCLINACERARSYKKALEVFDKMKSEYKISPDVVTYTSLINVCVKRNDVETAFKIFDQMKQDGVKPNAYTYTSLINVCERSKALNRALDMLDIMQRDGVMPNVLTFTSLINVCEQKKDLSIEKALDILTLMTKKYKVLPNVVTFNSLMKICANKKDVDKGYAIMKLMKEYNVVPNLVTFNSLMSICAKAKQHEKGFDVLERMKAHNVKPDNTTFTYLINSFSISNEEANNKPNSATGKEYYILDMMKHQYNISPDRITYLALLHLYLKSNSLERVIAVYERMKQDKIPLEGDIYFDLLKLCGKTGSFERGISLIQDMEPYAKVVPTARHFNYLLRFCESSKDTESARKLVDAMMRKSVMEDENTRSILKNMGIKIKGHHHNNNNNNKNNKEIK